MPRELITLQVGQCGNQIGCRFWDMALREHASHNKQGYFDEALSSFFRNVDGRVEPPLDLPVGDGKGKIQMLKARAVVIDMEEGVVNELLKVRSVDHYAPHIAFLISLLIFIQTTRPLPPAPSLKHTHTHRAHWGIYSTHDKCSTTSAAQAIIGRTASTATATNTGTFIYIELPPHDQMLENCPIG